MAVTARLRSFDLREQLGHAALKVAHYRVDQSLRARVPEQSGRLHCLMYDRVRGVRPRGELSERGEEQATHRGIGEWFLQQSLQGHVDHPVAPQRVIANILCCRGKRPRRRTAFQIGERGLEALPSGAATE